MPKENGAPAIILGWLASLKMTLFVFFTLAAASVIGTLLPQGMTSAEVHGNYGPTKAFIIDLLGLNNLYHTSWFRILLLLLCANLLVCTIDRLPKTIRLIQKREDPFDSDRLTKFAYNRKFTTAMPSTEAQSILAKAVSEVFAPLRELRSSDPFCAVSEKGRWSRLMVYGVHVSVLIVLAGALAGSILGFKGFMNLPEGAASDEVILSGGESALKLPFLIRCDKFDVSFYDTGAPKEFQSDLAIVQEGKDVLKESIRVNDPLTYDGITFYQASYGTGLKQAELELTDRDSGNKVTMVVPFREPGTIPGTKDQLEISEYQENLMRVGPALGVVIGKEGQKSTTGSWILVNKPDFHGNRVQNYQVRVLRTEEFRYTGLQVKRDPGIWLVWAGFSFMILGIGLTFYSSHQKIWVHAVPRPKDKGTIVTIAGRTSRNGTGFGDKFDELCTTLETRLNS
jgi:cytochrome c biogenesis protein